jgi:hypothetical protein
MWTGTRVPRNTGFPLMILPFNRSLVGARVERISSARALEMCLFLKNNQRNQTVDVLSDPAARLAVADA